MPVQIPDLPKGDQPPSYTDMADLLVKAFPEGDRKEARTLLLEQILPKSLIGLPDHPKPRRLAEIVYEDLAKTLRQAKPDQRLNTLHATVQRVDIQEQVISSLALAIARYLKDHPDATSKAGDWLDSTSKQWISVSIDDLKHEATQRLAQLEAWEQLVKAEFPSIWHANRLAFLHARLNLQSAHSGSFATAAGSLFDFLTNVGAAVDNFDIH